VGANPTTPFQLGGGCMFKLMAFQKLKILSGVSRKGPANGELKKVCTELNILMTKAGLPECNIKSKITLRQLQMIKGLLELLMKKVR
jgi:hypothetical protein